MRLIHSPRSIQREALRLKRSGKTISLVPTMGSLHEGHLSLVQRARKLADICVVSVFVNPTQFAPQEDLNHYPRNLAADRKLLQGAGVDIVFAPSKGDIYPEDFDTYVVPGELATILEGKFRPSHFRGVATVVLKLFNLVQPDVAVFGRKDLQQSVVIRRMVADLNLPVRIVVAPTVRASDKLALSSRNVYLTKSGRERALTISQSLFSARERIRAGEKSAAKIRNEIKRRLVKDAGAKVDYVSVAELDTLRELKRIEGEIAISLACTIDGIRLIDNITLKV